MYICKDDNNGLKRFKWQDTYSRYSNNKCNGGIKMKKITLTIFAFGILLLIAFLVSAHEQSFAETKQLINSNISCNNFTDAQFEAIGDYYMEQMHPGEAHELMDNMMGGEGSESLRQVHINMAKGIYCGESSGMMQMMMGGNMMGSGGIMGGSGGMMGGQNIQGSMMQGINGSYYSGYNVFSWLFIILVIIILVLLIVWLIKQIKSSGRGIGRRKK